MLILYNPHIIYTIKSNKILRHVCHADADIMHKQMNIHGPVKSECMPRMKQLELQNSHTALHKHTHMLLVIAPITQTHIPAHHLLLRGSLYCNCIEILI